MGAEPTPLLTYFLGLLVGQVPVAGDNQLVEALLERLGSQGQRLGAGIRIGIGWLC